MEPCPAASCCPPTSNTRIAFSIRKDEPKQDLAHNLRLRGAGAIRHVSRKSGIRARRIVSDLRRPQFRRMGKVHSALREIWRTCDVLCLRRNRRTRGEVHETPGRRRALTWPSRAAAQESDRGGRCAWRGGIPARRNTAATRGLPRKRHKRPFVCISNSHFGVCHQSLSLVSVTSHSLSGARHHSPCALVSGNAPNALSVSRIKMDSLISVPFRGGCPQQSAYGFFFPAFNGAGGTRIALCGQALSSGRLSAGCFR